MDTCGFDPHWDLKHKGMSKKATTKTFPSVLDNLKSFYEKLEPKHRKPFVDWLNEALDELLNDDAFGTEGQLDPRGDQRD